MAAVTNEFAVNDTASSQKAGERSQAWPVRTGLPVAVGATTFAGAPGNTNAWRGRHNSSCTAASASAAVRQPYASISACVIGQNTVLAKPPAKVSTVMAQR